MRVPEIPARQLVQWILGISAVVIGFWLLYRYQYELLMILAAVILGTAIRPGVQVLVKKGIPKPISVLIILGFGGLVLGILTWYTVPVLAEQGSALQQRLTEGYQSLYQSIQQIPNILVQRLVNMLPDQLGPSSAEPLIPESTIDEFTVDEFIAPIRSLMVAVLRVAAIVIMMFFWLMEGDRIKYAALLLVPRSRREQASEFVNEVENKVSRFLLGQGLLVLIIGILSFVAFLLIGVPNALLLAIIAGLFEAIPLLGPFLGTIPALIVGLSVSPLTGLLVIVAMIIIQQLENNFFVPRVMDSTIGLRPLVTLLALLTMGSLYGILGALLAIPLAAVGQVLFNYVVITRQMREQKEYSRDRTGRLLYETNHFLDDVRQYMRFKKEKPEIGEDGVDEIGEELESIAMGLEGFLARSMRGDTQ